MISLLLLVGAFGVGICYFWYSKLLAQKNRLMLSLNDIALALKKRRGFIPTILKYSEKFSAAEKVSTRELGEVLDRFANQSISANDGDRAQEIILENQMQSNLETFFAIAQNYPEIRNDPVFRKIKQSCTEVEAHLVTARQFYNSLALSFNQRILLFPGSLFATLTHWIKMPIFADLNANN
jgi:LemA protein